MISIATTILTFLRTLILSITTTMTPANDGWVTAAMADETMVVELLVGLHRDSSMSAKPLQWSVRQRRSKPISVTDPRKSAKGGSPATPLSWSGATSVSSGSAAAGGGAGSEESSLPPEAKLLNLPGSKIGREFQKTAFKRSRKKKNFAELQEEETLLIKENLELKRKIAALRSHLEKQKDANETMKRMKLELPPINQVSGAVSEETIPHQLQRNITGCRPFTPTLHSSASNGFSKQFAHATPESKFILPDLNIPFDEAQSSNFICRVS